MTGFVLLVEMERQSTLLKLITGHLTPKDGTIAINNKTEIGYFGQMNIDLNPDLSIMKRCKTQHPP